jgi:hypothetical protein
LLERSAAQAQGMSSSRREAGHRLTSLVSTSLNTLGYGGQKIKQILLNHHPLLPPDLSGSGTLRFSFSSP